MKHLYFLLLLFCTTRASHAQTYIGPLVGMDYSNFKSYNPDPNFIFFGITDTGFVNETPFWGFRAKQYLFKQVSFAYQFSYTEKKVNAITYGFIGFDGISFDYVRNQAVLQYKLANLFVLGVGGSFNVINDVHYLKNEQQFNQIERTIREKGWLFTLGINYRNFNLEGYYYKGKTMLHKTYFDLYPTRSLGIALSYDIRIWRGWRKHK